MNFPKSVTYFAFFFCGSEIEVMDSEYGGCQGIEDREMLVERYQASVMCDG